VDTDMIQNEATYRLFFPGVENPTRAQFAEAAQANDLLPVPWVESADGRWTALPSSAARPCW
jgi:(+)-trans-carveol dehydrogenase